jgi:hypothetical protein
MPTKKKISKSDIIGDQGIALIHQRVSGMGFLWHPTGLEAGIDGFIEIRNDETDEVTAHFVLVQSKATNVVRFTAETEISFEYLCDERDLDYWLNSNAPVVIIVSRPNKNEAYWACIKDRFKDLATRKARRINFDKNRDRFDATARAAIAKLAMPKDSGFYLAPPPKRERLYSNLLGVSRYAEKIFVAQTDLRLPIQMWDALRALNPQPLGEWVLTDKTLMSFHDLSEEPWRQVCDRGTVESFDSDEFAFSGDDGAVLTFTRLLNATLKEKLRPEHIRYDRDFRYYHFTPTRLLTPREIHYRSLEKNTSRVVFGPYYHKKDTTKLRYYRHHAFEGQFRRFDEGWYLQITPTYRYTSDGKATYRWYEDELRGLKRLENNQAVLGQVVMWASILGRPPDLFDKNPFLVFGELKAFDLDAGVFDEAWLPQEDAEAPDEDEPVLDDPQLKLFKS